MSNVAITLIALVITIIVLLILAGVVLNLVIGENGIFSKANKAKEDTNYSTALEEINIIILQAQTEAASENRKANIKDIVEELKKDSRYTYVINTSPRFSEYSYIIKVSPQYATISDDGNIKDTVDVTDETTVIYVIHKGYEFKIGEDLKAEYIGKEGTKEEKPEEETLIKTEVKWNKVKIKVTNDSKNSGKKYKYILTDEAGNIITGSSNDYEDIKEKEIEGLTEKTKYKLKVVGLINGEEIESEEVEIETPEKFYEISTINDLEDINSDLAGKYKLTKSLDFKDPNSYKNGSSDERYIYYNTDADGDGKPDNSWIPIASGDYFTGRFDGDYYTINNLYVNKPESSKVGLFSWISNDSVDWCVRNLCLKNVDITGAFQVRWIDWMFV